jgi:transposase, IS5 family
VVEQQEFQVNDRCSFEEFVGLGVMNTIPDATTIALFRERLRKANVINEYFVRFEELLRPQGLEARGEKIIGPTLAQVPKQRKSRPENEAIKRGQLQEG